MAFLKKIFKQESFIIGLCGLKKKKEYIKINIPQNYKNTYLTNTEHNYILY